MSARSFAPWSMLTDSSTLEERHSIADAPLASDAALEEAGCAR